MVQGGRDDAAFLREFVAGRDLSCPGCGYNVRGLQGRRCPECNQELALELRLAEPRVGAWVVALAGVFAGAVGGGAVLTAYLLARTLGKAPPAPPGKPSWILLYIPAAALASCGLCVLLLARPPARRWFRALTPRKRGAVIASCWVLSGLFFGAMVGVMMSA